MKQMNLNLFRGKKGGRRPGCGRKRIHSNGVAHRVREKVNHRTPLHINFKYKTFIRNKTCLRLLKRAILNSRKHGLRIIHFSLQHNHVHLIVVSDTNTLLTKGMRSLTVTFAKGLNQGRVQIERYHLHVLRSLRETRNAIQYVLFNQQKHEKGTYSAIDEYSSLLSLNNWREIVSEFTKKSKMTLKIGKSDWKPDESRSYLLKKALVREGSNRS